MLTKLFDKDFPDPSAFYDSKNKWIYLYGSRAYDGKGTNIQLYRARSWHGPWIDLGLALSSAPDWGKKSTEFWCPDRVIKVEAEYRLYYATNPDDIDGMAIAFATSAKPYDFIPGKKYVVGGDAYSVVDPFILPYRGSHWLFWGSNRSPIQCQELTKNGYEFVAGSSPQIVLEPSSRKYEQLLEGFFLFQDPQTSLWFAFVSGSDTWTKDGYAVTCFKSVSPFGPFERVGVLIRFSKQWWAPGQNSVVTKGGKHYFVCHAADADNPYFLDNKNKDRLLRVPCVAEVVFAGGRPVLKKLAAK